MIAKNLLKLGAYPALVNIAECFATQVEQENEITIYHFLDGSKLIDENGIFSVREDGEEGEI